MSTTEERIAALETDIVLLKSAIAGIARAPASTPAAPSSPEGACASDADLDGEYGDFAVRKDPPEKYWKGTSSVGVKLSECSPEYLDAFAKHRDVCAYMNEKNGDPEKAKYIVYDRRDAARARGWAKRIRTRGPTPQTAPVDKTGEFDEFAGSDAFPF